MDSEITYLLQKILMGQAKIEERLANLEQTVNPQMYERLNPEYDSGDEFDPPF